MPTTLLSSPELLVSLIQAVNLGLILLDEEEHVVVWNRWLEDHSPVSSQEAKGKKLFHLFPELQTSRLAFGIRSALDQHLPSILSQSLNRAPFPLFDSSRKSSDRLEQAITLVPLLCDDHYYCLIQIQDVTSAVLRENKLREQAQQLQALSNVDGLTGVANRRNFDTRFLAEFQRATRKASPISLLMLDIDHFKTYNDTYGHQVGDACLIAVAHTLKNALKRSSDFVARYGGEEFAILLPDSNSHEARAVAEQILEQVAKLQIPLGLGKGTSSVTISIGIATMTPGRTDNPASFLSAADQALYHAKNQGRAQIADDPGFPPH